MELSKTCVDLIGKIIGVKFYDLAQIDNVLTLHKKNNEFRNVADFMYATGRTNIGPLLNHFKKVIQAKCEALPGYISWDVSNFDSEINRLKKLCPHANAYAIKANSGKNFLSFNIRSANFTALKACGLEATSWEAFFRSMFPKDPDSPSQMPSIIYQSKFVRMYVLSSLFKLQKWWELQALRLLQSVEVALPSVFQQKLYVTPGSDEVVIDIGNARFDQVPDLLSLIPTPSYFDIQLFQINSLPPPEDEPQRNFMLKTFITGEKELMNVTSKYFNDFFSKYCV